VLDAAAVERVLRTIDDPEMPISIVDLGIVADVRIAPGPDPVSVDVDMAPTFVGCPALDMIRAEIETKLHAAGAARVRVNFVYDPPWTVDRISDAGREALRRHGVSVPERGGACTVGARDAIGSLNNERAAPTLVPLGIPETSDAGAAPCPFCGAEKTTLESRFGPTRCRAIYYCPACKNSFERLRRV
jgi:ring-1,2-phenylacetyl-CoA epoxidase subunit PaaD